MEPAEGKIGRYVLILGKFRVVERTEGTMKLALGGSTTMTVALPEQADVRSGDILTLYTEVLHAKPKQTPIQ